MPRLTKIYTRGGDDGSTGLGTGRRVRKDDPQVEAYGEVDELNAVIGAALAADLAPETGPLLTRVQSELLNLGGELCLVGDEGAPRELITDRHVAALETACDLLNSELGPLENFILPGGCEGAARLHVARTVCRRAERRVISFAEASPVSPALIRYLNRLSDLLFIMARFENRRRGVEDVLWDTGV